jgi:hypothetical protein
VGEHRDSGEEQHLSGNDRGWEGRPFQSAHEAVGEDNRAREEERQDDQRGNAVGPAPPEREVRAGAIEIGQDVDVREIGADQQGCGPESRAPGESAARQDGADERVTDRVYGRLIRRSVG